MSNDNGTKSPHDFDRHLVIGAVGEEGMSENDSTSVAPRGNWTYGQMILSLTDALVWAIDQVPTNEDKVKMHNEAMQRLTKITYEVEE